MNQLQTDVRILIKLLRDRVPEKKASDMRNALTGFLTLAALLITSTSVAADVETWRYKGRINDATKADGYEARARVNDDFMSILYFKLDDAFYLWFTYNGTQSFSQSKSNQAEIFIRTRDISGSERYESDYVFKGKTIAQPDPDPSKPQFVATKLTSEDIQALKNYSGNDIGAGYFMDDDQWRTYKFPGKNLWEVFVEDAIAADRADVIPSD